MYIIIDICSRVKLDWLLFMLFNCLYDNKKWLHLIINLIIIIRRRIVCIFGIVPLFFYILNFHQLIDIERLCHVISPPRPALCIPLQPLLCAIHKIFIIHHGLQDIIKLLFKNTENLVNKYHFCLVDKRKGHKQNVCLGICQLWKVLHWFFVQCRLCNLHFAWLSLIDKCVLLIFILLSFHCRRKRAV